MKKLKIAEAEDVILALQDEIRRSPDARYDHRLHAVLLVAQGMSGREVAFRLGDSPRTVAYWIQQFERRGLAGLSEGQRSGRPPRLTAAQLGKIGEVIRKRPEDYGLRGNLWDGKTLSAYIALSFHENLGVRQCQRIFRQLGFRLRKPRPMIAHANPEIQRLFKKTAKSSRKP